MRYGLSLANFGDFAEPRRTVELARAAEASGWDGLFLWDHLAFAWGPPAADPWTILAAVAATTERLTLGTAVSPIARERPHLLAQRLATLDRLSGGRVVLGVGLGGVASEFARFGEPAEARVRAEMVDEALPLLDRLWSGETVRHEGRHYTVRDVRLAPLPLQRPRIPIWVGGMSEAALRRTARWDGWLPSSATQGLTMALRPEELAERIARLRDLGAGRERPFEVAVDGYSRPADRALAAEYAAGGATWWLESLHGARGSPEELLARVAEGPPR